MSGRPRLCSGTCASLLLASSLLSGCAVVSVAGAAVSVGATAVSVGAGAVGLAADAAIGTARIAGKGAGAVVDAFSDKRDNSGVHVRFREPTAADRAVRQAAEAQALEHDPTHPDAIQAQRDAGLHPNMEAPQAHTAPAAGPAPSIPRPPADAP